MKPIHPLVLQCVPEISGSDREKLRAGIQSTGGLIYPIIVADGQVIDGRTRQELCAELGIEPRYEEYTGTLSVPEYILQCNLRRNLTESQSDAMIMALGRKIIPQLRKEAKESQIRKSVPRNSVEQTKDRGSETQKRFRKLVGHSDKADAVLSVHNHDDLAAAVEKKEISLKEAHKTARKRRKGTATVKEESRRDSIRFPTPEETGFPVNGTMKEKDAHHRKYGRTPLHAKAVKDMLNHSASVTGYIAAILSVTNETQPDALSFFESIEAMKKWEPQPERGKDWGIDFARKARQQQALLRERLPLLVKRVEELSSLLEEKA